MLLLPGLSVELAFISWGPRQDSLRRYTWTASTSVLGIKKWRCRVYVKTQIDLNLMIQLVLHSTPLLLASSRLRARISSTRDKTQCQAIIDPGDLESQGLRLPRIVIDGAVQDLVRLGLFGHVRAAWLNAGPRSNGLACSCLLLKYSDNSVVPSAKERLESQERHPRASRWRHRIVGCLRA